MIAVVSRYYILVLLAVKIGITCTRDDVWGILRTDDEEAPPMKTYFPYEIFPPSGTNAAMPRVFISPQRYVQGPDILSEVGRYLSLVEAKRAGVLISERGRNADGVTLLASLASAGIEPHIGIFNGECSLPEIDVQTGHFREGDVDCLLAVGGGKCVDAGKAIAYRLAIPVVVIPTLASNDAPCSALSVLYSPDGISSGVEFYPSNPAMVVVDTRIVAAAPERYLVAGMGDAMATWYEALVCLRNEQAVTAVWARPTLASAAIGEVCARTLFESGVDAAAAVARGEVSESLEKVVEANTLLSGLGFESGGVAAAHGFAQSYTGITTVRDNYLHGEMVAMGTTAQLVMESRLDEATRVAEFFAKVGLPVHLGQVSLSATDTGALDTLIEGTLEFPFIDNMPMKVDADVARNAVLGAHELGISVADKIGDAAYRRLHRN